MNESVYARFAGALVDLAIADQQLTDYQKALAEVDKTFEKNPSFLATLSSFAIPKDELYKLVQEAFAPYKLPHLVSFLDVLVDQRIIGHFHDVYLAFNSGANRVLGVKEGIVYSTIKLDETSMKTLEESLAKRLNCQVSLTNRLEPKSLLGGIKVFIDGRVYDGSLAGQIEKMRSRLLKIVVEGEKV